MQLFLTDFIALGWFCVFLLIAIAIIYTLLFIPLHFWAGIHPSRAIRIAWTGGLLTLLFYLIFLSPFHSRYLTFWTGDPSSLINMLICIVLFAAILIPCWISEPQIDA